MAVRSANRCRCPKKERASVADACTRSAPATTARSWRIPKTTFERLVMFELRMVIFLRYALLERNVLRAADANRDIAPRDLTGGHGPWTAAARQIQKQFKSDTFPHTGQAACGTHPPRTEVRPRGHARPYGVCRHSIGIPVRKKSRKIASSRIPGTCRTSGPRDTSLLHTHFPTSAACLTRPGAAVRLPASSV